MTVCMKGGGVECAMLNRHGFQDMHGCRRHVRTYVVEIQVIDKLWHEEIDGPQRNATWRVGNAKLKSRLLSRDNDNMISAEVCREADPCATTGIMRGPANIESVHSHPGFFACWRS
jgi:hypothetical protein